MGKAREIVRKRDGSKMPLEIVPTLPGHVLRHQVLKRLRVTQTTLAGAMGISQARISLILSGHAPITANVAIRIGNATATDPAYWLELQTKYDLHHVSRRLKKTLEGLTPLPEAPKTQ